MTYSCQCPCGSNQFQIDGEPITRFYCHCTICQDKYQAPFVNAVLFRLEDVEVSKGDAIAFGRYKRFGAIDRGICDNCNKPVMAKVAMVYVAKVIGILRHRPPIWLMFCSPLMPWMTEYFVEYARDMITQIPTQVFGG